MKETKLILKGATCPSCRFAIEKYARKLTAVSDIYIEPGDGSMTIFHEDGTNPVAEIQDLVRKLGYETQPVE